MNENEITIIGAGVIDILVKAEDLSNLLSSREVQSVKSSFGGDALNESVVLSRLGKKVHFISKVGNDTAGRQILDFLGENNIDIENIIVEDNLETSINIVLIDTEGERSFLTNPNGSLRKLNKEDILNNFNQQDGIVSFASIFVSPELGIPEIKEIFSRIKDKNNILIVDSTSPKNNEGIKDIEPLLKYIDYYFINEAELLALSGEENIKESIDAFLSAGVKNLIVKLGRKGALYCNSKGIKEFSSYLIENPVDSTGAGDSYVAGFIYGLHNDWNIEECLRFGAAVSSCIVEEMGATTGIKNSQKPVRRFKSMIRK